MKYISQEDYIKKFQFKLEFLKECYLESLLQFYNNFVHQRNLFIEKLLITNIHQIENEMIVNYDRLLSMKEVIK